MNAIGEQISAILWNVFNRPRLIDLIDILLLTIIIYELLVHVRQTRVSQTIKGIIILLLATWLSDVLGMRTIHALLAWMINAGPVLPNTPLHDGAVVIRGDRVIAAACLLRLSDTTGVGRDLGTRHRAGLGVSEISDAKVFIVSEETGIISMAEGGRLVRHLDEASLRQILHGIYDTQDSDARMPLLHFRQRRKSAHDEQQADKKA